MANYQIREFHDSVAKWIKASQLGLEDVVRIMVANIHKDLVYGSPVDTGRFRANWQITANVPPFYALNQYDKDGKKTIAEGKRITNAMLTRGAAITTIYFSNMLIYANALEYGHSKQAPAGVLGIVAIRLRSYVNNAIKESRLKNGIR
ncbi:tail completion or Neck1 protein [Escherichia phage vB_EcoS_NBD2]|uniref:Neck protein n=1 Tax=Escherichia phage vB_EcoS_NBD2 TaxID=1852563 RepID=A0A192Y7R0_9CAUD|nr:tail completion or Neck1 protein [Escherichia phage vB_EcoS_NBD2]ANM45879.1 hypothetical protein NBD2_37 [Escherichia phage vB_EcoS_NBD2]